MPNAMLPNAAPEPAESAKPAPDVQSRELARSAAEGHDKRRYVQGMFSDIAPRYDLLNHLLSMNIDKAWRKKALRRLNWTSKPDGTFLDVCAGTLDVGATLSRLKGFAGFIVGADFAFPMLKHGSGKASRDVLSPVTADAMLLPLRDKSMDGAIVAFGIRNVSDLDVCLREVLRVLRPGARFVILEFSTPSSFLVRSFYHAYFHYMLPLVGKLVSGHGSAYTYLPLSVSKFPTLQALADRMKQSGFVDVTYQTLTFGIAAIHVGTVPKGTLPTGALPTGALPTGALPTGALPTGALPTGALPTGALPAVAAR